MIQINRLHQFIDDHRESTFSKTFLYAKSIDGNFLTLNQRSAKMAGAEVKEIIGKNDTDLCWSQHADEYRRNDLDCIQSKKPILCQEKLLTFDNKKFFEISLKTPLVNKDNHIVGIAGMSFIPNESKPHELKELLDHFNHYFALNINTLTYDTPLTKKETECAYLLCLGLSAKTISCIMDLSTRTVESYIEQIKNKYLIEKKSLLPIKLVNSGIINLCKLKKIAKELESTIIRQKQ